MAFVRPLLRYLKEIVIANKQTVERTYMHMLVIYVCIFLSLLL